MSGEPDLVVLGAGPAGMAAALAASRSGVATVIVDQAHAAGGQVYRPLPASYSATDALRRDPDFAAGERMRGELAASPVGVAFGHAVWRIAPGFEIEALGPDGSKVWRPKALIAATGAYERCVPFPGWTLPGVIGLAAATILLKSQQVLPGERVVVAGCGPLLAAVAAGVLKADGEVAAVVDLAGPSEWLGLLPALASRPDMLRRGLSWLKALRAAGVPILSRSTVVEVIGNDEHMTRVVVKRATAAGAPAPGAKPLLIDADCLAIGHGLVPSTEVTRALRARHAYRPDCGGWVAECDAGCRTSIERLYVCGDGAGIRGAASAALQGEIAGVAAAHDLGRISPAEYAEKAAALSARHRRAARFGAALARMMRLRPEMMSAIERQTIVCRCEDIARSEVEAALQTGAVDLNQLKSWTRAGMGPCQGRTCGETIATLAAGRLGGPERVGMWTGRFPLRPVAMAGVVGAYRYEDLVWGGNKAAIDDEGRPLSK